MSWPTACEQPPRGEQPVLYLKRTEQLAQQLYSARHGVGHDPSACKAIAQTMIATAIAVPPAILTPMVLGAVW